MDKPVNMSRGQGLTGADEVHPEAKRDDIFVEWDGQEEEPDWALIAEQAEGHPFEDLVDAECENDQKASNGGLWSNKNVV